MEQERILDVSLGSVLKLFIVAMSFYGLYLIREILLWFIFGLVLSILFTPAIDFLQKRRIPRVAAVILLFMGVFGILAFFIYSIAPFFVYEIQQFTQFLPDYFDKVSPLIKQSGLANFDNFETFMNSLGATVRNLSSNIFNALFSIFGGIFSTFFIITVAVFISLEDNPVEKALSLFLPKKYESYALSLWEKCQQNVAGWFGVKVLGMIFIGIISYLSFIVLNIKYPFSLALFAGLMNFIPIIGPLITGVLLAFLVSLDSVFKAIFVIIIFMIIQQIEGNILTPILTQRFIRLPPTLVLMSLAAGGVLFGMWGAILFTPLAGIVFEFLEDFLKKRKEEEERVPVTES